MTEVLLALLFIGLGATAGEMWVQYFMWWWRRCGGEKRP